MSGGSLDYVYRRVDDAIEAIEARATTAQQRAFAAHLRLVSKALHDLEWVWSADKSPGDEEAAIAAVVTPAAVLAEAVAQARKAQQELTEALVLAGLVLASNGP
jgi:hypothetical protein